MTKTLSLNTTSIKFSDDKTDLIFIVSKDGQIVKSNITPTLKIKQVDKGYLTSVVGAWVDGHIVISSSNLKLLPVGQYLVELWLSDETGDDIYPDTGFIRLGINQNSTGLTGDLVSSITLQDFQSQFNDLSTEILKNLPEGKVGQQGIQGVQGVQGETGLAGKDGKDGVNGKDAVINVVTQAEYDALPDKTGVYFIGG